MTLSPSALRFPPLKSFHVSSVAAAVLIAYGVRDLLEVMSRPITAVVVRAINYVILTGRFETLPLQPVFLSLVIECSGAFVGAVLLLGGLWLGSWSTKYGRSA